MLYIKNKTTINFFLCVLKNLHSKVAYETVFFKMIYSFCVRKKLSPSKNLEFSTFNELAPSSSKLLVAFF